VTYTVSRDPSRKAPFNSIRQALQNAKVGSTIELWDDTYEENLLLDPARGMTTAVTLQAAPGKEIIWRGRDATQPILWIAKGADFKLKGKGIVLDGTVGKEKVKDLMMITSRNPDLLIEDVQFKSFARSAVLIMNAAGNPGNPIRLKGLWTVTQENDKPAAAIYFDANPNVPLIPRNEHIEITDLKCVGIDADKAVSFRDEKVIGDDVKWPGR
ncbi:MAG TPA: hypothetical protein VFE62_23885, partial [Gemmataceae bacterium]|nr:hypothetical protein [Gemmataceae bacterium]